MVLEFGCGATRHLESYMIITVNWVQQQSCLCFRVPHLGIQIIHSIPFYAFPLPVHNLVAFRNNSAYFFLWFIEGFSFILFGLMANIGVLCSLLTPSFYALHYIQGMSISNKEYNIAEIMWQEEALLLLLDLPRVSKSWHCLINLCRFDLYWYKLVIPPNCWKRNQADFRFPR